jgi:hypothetical protein
LIILTMTHIIEFVSGATFISVTWDVIWNLVTTTFLSNLHMVRMIYMCLYKPVRWQGSDVDGCWIFRHPGVLLFLWKLVGRSKWHLLSYHIPQFNKTGVILLKLVVCWWSKSLRQLFPQQRCQKCLLLFINANRIWRFSQAHRIPL